MALYGIQLLPRKRQATPQPTEKCFNAELPHSINGPKAVLSGAIGRGIAGSDKI